MSTTMTNGLGFAISPTAYPLMNEPPPAPHPADVGNRKQRRAYAAKHRKAK